jgi:hypothetical protein
MKETTAELAALQDLLDRSFAQASPHLTSIMTEPRRLSAERLVAEFPAPAVLNIAVVTARGEPRISAVDGHFLHGHWYFTTSAESPKARQLRARPAISASFTPRDGFGMFCYGRAVELAPGNELEALDAHWTLTYGQPLSAFGIAIYAARIDCDWLVAFAMTAEDEEQMAQAAAERTARRQP